MNIHHTTKTTLLAFLGFMCLTTELEAKFNPLKYINPGYIIAGTLLATLFRLHSKESIANFTETRVERYDHADFYMKPVCYIDDWIIGQRESSNLLKVTDKKYIKFSCKDSADAAGFFGILEACIEPYQDALKNAAFIALLIKILFKEQTILSHPELNHIAKTINKVCNRSSEECYRREQDYNSDLEF